MLAHKTISDKIVLLNVKDKAVKIGYFPADFVRLSSKYF